jgi:tripartite-type tricarboxylate transporter receptor subunit TctC
MWFRAEPMAVVTLTIALFCAVAAPEAVFSQTPYYQGKTITIVRGGEPGGSGDMQARALIPFLKKYIPGNPTIVVENMPGAAGMKAVNHIYSTAKPDGLSITAVGSGLASGAILGLPGARYDIDKLIYLGSTEHGDPYVFLSRKESGFDTLEKLRAASGVKIAAQTVGHAVYVSGRIFTYLLGLKDPKIIVGFGGVEMDAALARGEIDARANSADTVVRRNAEAFAKGDYNIHATLTIPKGKFHPRFNNVADADSLAKNDRERQLIGLFREFMYPLALCLPPGTPPEIVKTLREAMNRSFKDPGFAQEFKKLMGGEPSPLTGEEVETSIRQLPRDPEVVGLYKKMAEHGPLPPR